MKKKGKATISITFCNSELDKVIAFKEAHVKLSHREIYLRGLNEIDTEFRDKHRD